MTNYPASQRQREADLVKAMRADLSREADRQAAELKVREGVSVNLADLAIPPTPEWERQGEAINYTVKTEGQNVQVVTTRRRVAEGQCYRAAMAGRITAEQLVACRWYRDQLERSGLDGKVRSVDLSAEVHGGADGTCMFTERQVEAQTNIREARAAIGARFVKFFELVVLADVPVDRARRIAPSGRHPWVRLRSSADAVYSKMKDLDPDWQKRI